MGPTPKWDPASPRRPRSQHDARRDAFYTLMKSEAQWKKNRSSAGQDDKKENGSSAASDGSNGSDGSLRSASDVVVDRDNANTDEYGSDNEQDIDQSDPKMSQGQSDIARGQDDGDQKSEVRSQAQRIRERLQKAADRLQASMDSLDELTNSKSTKNGK